MQRVAIKKMLADWERDFPGRTETIFRALRHVEPEHLADPRRFDFAGLDARACRAHERGGRRSSRGTVAPRSQPRPERAHVEPAAVRCASVAQLLLGDPGQAARRRAPARRRWRRRGSACARLLQAGVDCFIDLTQADELAAYAAELPVSIEYFRKPIPDHGHSARAAHMAEILDCLHDALHARAAWSTCTAAPASAVRAWSSDACSPSGASRGGGPGGAQPAVAPERARGAVAVGSRDRGADRLRAASWTREAAAEADPLLDPRTLAAARTLRERFHGALLGLAVGDAVAAATQYARRGHFTPVGDMLGGGPFDLPRGGWSDDTAMALCLAESLLERKASTPGTRWSATAAGSRRGICPPPASASASPPAPPGRSRWPNGGASRSPAHTTPRRWNPKRCRAWRRW